MTAPLAFILFTTWPAQADPLPNIIRVALRQAQIPRDHIGLVVQALDHTKAMTRFNADVAFNPASVMKAVTTLAALDTLGPAYTFKTQILIDGAIADGVLAGNLVIRGGGDPALTLEHFHTLLREIRARGIGKIDGDVIFDNSFFAIAAEDPTAFDGEPLKPYNAAPAALLVNYNVLPLRLAPVQDGLSAHLEPPDLPVENRLDPDNETACAGWRHGLTASREGDRLMLSGRYPTACGDRVLWLNLMPPAATAAAVFRAEWARLGGVLTGQIRLNETPASATSLLDFNSPPLTEIVRGANKFSNNVMAKMLLLDLGAARFGAPATWDKGQRAIREWLIEQDLAIPELVIENGSGLSRAERISAASMARLLIRASKLPLYYEFAASLPALGLEGTQRHRLKDTPLAGRAWLKSGSLDGIHNLAGYVLDADGQRKAVVLFLRAMSARQAETIQAAVLHWAMDGKHRLHRSKRKVNSSGKFSVDLYTRPGGPFRLVKANSENNSRYF
ncbi:MAG: D-alanyl-D-alanine carboxypeptidase/D-alanyl-D-alanine-endopeptidase [Betaproteobacteria bacterium]|nr:D-alanyl-D-alanine carboxypeptidase/D-alanyl-D-alanine-endopeptidase [Betaproteobacteria bacterium]